MIELDEAGRPGYGSCSCLNDHRTVANPEYDPEEARVAADKEAELELQSACAQ